MDQESTLDLIYEDSLSDYEISEDGEMNEVLPRKFESMEIDTSEDHEEGELPPDGGTCYSPTSAVFVGRDADFGPGQDLDQAIKEAKINRCNPGPLRRDFVGESNVQSRFKSKNKKRKRESISRFVLSACRALKEPKPALVRAAVDKLGRAVFQGLMNEVDVVERYGGQMTADGKRRRTPGGVLWNILRARVQPEVYKHIMHQGKLAEKKAPVHARQQGPSGHDAHGSVPGCDLQKHRPSVHKAKQRKIRANKPLTDASVVALASGEEDFTPSLDNLAVPQHAQNAWSEGVLKSKGGPEKSDAPEVAPSAGEGKETQKKKVPVSDRLRFPVQYDDDLLNGPPSGSQGEEGVMLAPSLDKVVA